MLKHENFKSLLNLSLFENAGNKQFVMILNFPGALGASS